MEDDKPETWRFESKATQDLTTYLDDLEHHDAIASALVLTEEIEGSSKDDFENTESEEKPAFRAPGDAATLPELIRFLIDRTGYIKALETEGSPEAFSRIENLKELANAAHDAEARGETLAEFLDHAALASDTDQYDPEARVTLMTLHAAKGLEFPLVFLAGLEEGLFPHSRTLNNPDELEEERRLMYVGITRAQRSLHISYSEKRKQGREFIPSEPSRFIAEMGKEDLRFSGGKADSEPDKASGAARLLAMKAMLSSSKNG